MVNTSNMVLGKLDGAERAEYILEYFLCTSGVNFLNVSPEFQEAIEKEVAQLIGLKVDYDN